MNWVAASEDPPAQGPYLVCFSPKEEAPPYARQQPFVRQSYWTGTRWRAGDKLLEEGSYWHWQITHWMPLPEPPRGMGDGA